MSYCQSDLLYKGEKKCREKASTEEGNQNAGEGTDGRTKVRKGFGWNRTFKMEKKGKMTGKTE